MFKKFSLIIAILSLLTALPFSGCSFKGKTTSYEITCEYSEGVIKGEEKVTFYNNTENVFTEIKFNCFANAYRSGAKYCPIVEGRQSSAYYSGIDYGGIEIKKVCSNGEDLEHEICGEDLNILTVKLPVEVFPEESFSLNIEFETKLAKVNARTGITKSTINLSEFYPIICGITDGEFYECVYYANGDPFYSDIADYKVKLTFPETFVVASSGRVIEEVKSEGKKTTTYQINSARSFALVLSESFESVTDSSTGVEINYYYYKDETPNKSLQTAIDSVNFFKSKFGEYPYPTYSVVQTGFPQGGMEFPALVYISDELEDKAYREVIVHETAHQWWQTTVGNNQVEYGFLDEGLAEYSVVLFYENYSEYGYTRKVLIESSEKTYRTFCSVYDKIFGNVNTVMLRPLKDFSSEYEYVNIAYVKPCIMFDYLRTTIGDEKFFKGLKNYYSAEKFKNATPDDLISAFEKTGADSKGFFLSFFEGKAII